MRKIWGVAAVLATVSLVACGGGTTVTGPEEVAEVAAPSAPTAVATPQPVAPAPVSGGFELACSAGAVLTVTNNSGNVARVDTFYTTFDNQSATFGLQQHTIQSGDFVKRTFAACQQADADRPGVKEIGGCFFDVNGSPFNPTHSPAKVDECRRQSCVYSAWGEWGQWSEWSTIAETTVQERFRTRTRTVVSTPFNGQRCPDVEAREREERNLACEDFKAPSLDITGSPATDTTGDSQGFEGAGTVAPAGGTFSPALPYKGNKPAYGAQPLVLTTTYSVSQKYGPQALECSVRASKDFTYTIQPETTPPCQYPTASGTPTISNPTYTAAAPKKYVYTFGDNSSFNVNACEAAAEGGTFDNGARTCTTTHDHGYLWITNYIPYKSGNKTSTINAVSEALPAITGSATVSGAGVWTLKLRATNPGNYDIGFGQGVKDAKSVTLTCNSAPATLNVTYGWLNHSSEDWYTELYRDNVLFGTSAVRYNPSN